VGYKVTNEHTFYAREAIYTGSKEATCFSPALTKVLYDMLLGHIASEKKITDDKWATVLDPFSGWGDRAIGALACKHIKHYQGIDCNEKLSQGYQKIKETLPGGTDTLDFKCTQFENFESKEQYDVILTSPPYFDFEKYSDSPTQSTYDRHTYKTWFDKFMKPCLNKMVKFLKPGGYIALHIGSTFRTPAFHTNATYTILENKDMKFVAEINCGIKNKRPIPVWVFKKLD